MNNILIIIFKENVLLSEKILILFKSIIIFEKIWNCKFDLYFSELIDSYFYEFKFPIFFFFFDVISFRILSNKNVNFNYPSKYVTIYVTRVTDIFQRLKIFCCSTIIKI